MGLLDGLLSGGGSGGLLDFLRNNALNQQFSSGLQSDQAQYGQQPQYSLPMQAMAQAPIGAQPNAQPSPLDTARWPYGPNGAPSQASAQMPPQQPPPVIPAQPQMAMPQGPGIGDRLMAGLQSFAHGGGILPAIAGGISGLATGQRSDPEGVAQQQTQQMQNHTLQYFINHGVNPADAAAAVTNPKLMESLIEQMKPKDPQILGQGYVLPHGSNKAVRLYEPDEKTPAGFATDAKGMHYVPGGPADPAYIQLAEAKKKDPNGVFTLGRGGELYKIDKDGNPVVVHKNDSTQAEATLDEPTVTAMASQYLAGDKSVMQNLGRGAQGAANIVKLRTEIYNQANQQGLNGKDIVNNFNEQAGNLAGQRSIGTRSANISLAANEANNMIPIALKASDAVPRGEWMPWNKMVQAYQTGTSSPELARFVAATNSLVNSYVRAVSPSGVPTDSMREHAYSMLNSAQSAKAYKAVTDIMQDEMKAAMEAPGQVRKELRHEEKPAETAPDISRADAEAELRRRGKIK